ncbi:MAG: UDP-N-acetylglucosamine 1-carboxyvinyltransferase [Myxococcota bacterium]
MDRIVIQGGASLSGELKVSGSKNSALALMAGALLGDGETRLRNVPRLRDVEAMVELLAALGARVRWSDEDLHTLTIDPNAVNRPEAPYELVRKMRASFMVLGPLVGRFGMGRVSEPGGCAIGVRPVDQHMKGLEALGAKVRLDHGTIEASASRLRGGRVRFDLVTVNGTQNVLMAACLASGETVLENAAREPEVVELAEFLCRMGAEIHGAGSDCIVVRGVSSLRPLSHAVAGDRIEAGTLLAAAAATRGSVRLVGIDSATLESTVEALRAAGADIVTGPDELHLRGVELRGTDVVTAPFPGFPTDMQAQLMALLSMARGSSVITETVFENRFMHVPELIRMGADIRLQGRSAHVRGVPTLEGAPVMATDLRASACLIVAGLAARGETIVNRVYHIDRGYEHIEQKLASLGATIRREG